MKVRGRRECADCGHEWSYYDTGSVACPSCESLRSVGIDERTRHTATHADLDLFDHHREIQRADDVPIEECEALKSTLREHLRERGFIDAGDLLPLGDDYLAAHELRQVTDVLIRRQRSPKRPVVSEAERLYFYRLLKDAPDGERPPLEAVPDEMTAARGLAYANAIAEYRREVLTWLEDEPDPDARRVLGTLGEHLKRVQALQGDVPLGTAEALVQATADVVTYLREGDETALSRAEHRLTGFEV